MNATGQISQFLFSSVRIETYSEDQEALGSGTSFVVTVSSFPEDNRLFLVSNKHVITGASRANVFFTEKMPSGEPNIGAPFFAELNDFDNWHGHPDEDVDVAVMPLSCALSGGSKVPYLRPISLEEFATSDQMDHMEVTNTVVFIGYPNGMFDEEHYLPIVRRGATASAPDLDFNGEPVFLIDASVFPGSSGSPVFSFSEGRIGGPPHLKLLGLVASVITQTTDGSIEWVPAPTNLEPIPVIDQMIDLGVVFKTRTVKETLQDFGKSKLAIAL